MYPHLFVFDMIGTTVQPSEAIPAAFKAAVGKAGVELSDDDIQAVRGKSKRQAIAELLPGKADTAAQDKVYADFKSRLESHYRQGGVRSISGSGETFAWCRSVGAQVALTTGFDREIANLILDSLGWQGVVDHVVCNDDVPEGRPAPHLIQRAMELARVNASSDVASIGDTVSDLEAGSNAAVRWNFGVLSGAHDRARLSTVPGAVILPDIAALRERDWP